MAEAGQRLTVVYIEDNQENLSLVTRLLEATGRYRVVGVQDGAAGLGVIEKERPALILTDLDVPNMNGFEIARQVKASPFAATPVVVVSANVLKGERQAALQAGAQGFIEKPFDIGEFRREIARVLREAGHGGL